MDIAIYFNLASPFGMCISLYNVTLHNLIQAHTAALISSPSFQLFSPPGTDVWKYFPAIAFTINISGT